MFNEQEKEKINRYYRLAMNTILTKNIACFKNHEKPVFLISEEYPGVWLEHAYDSLMLAKLDRRYCYVAENTLNLFMEHQKRNGQLPCYIIDRNKNVEMDEYGYTQIQECVSFTRICFEYYGITGDKEFLEKAYEHCKMWQKWYEENRIPHDKGLVEIYCGYDTGHDGSPRKNGMKYKGRPKNKNINSYPEDDDVLPIIAPDVNAVYFGTLSALADMADELGNDEAQAWREKADTVKKRITEVCYDEADEFFYDVDKNGNKRKCLSISITAPFVEHMLDRETADKIYERHLKNPQEFFTDYPFPAVAKCDPEFRQNRAGNSWGFYSQALTILRCTRWMDYYGRSDDFNTILEIWVRQWTFCNGEIMFGQELNPLTGEPSECSPWYSSCMLVYVYAVNRLGLLS